VVRPREKPIGSVITLSMSKDTRAKLEKIAKKEKRTMSAMIEYLIEQYKL
jgi:predicted transcriptional regulator